jgi:hypothetical protein
MSEIRLAASFVVTEEITTSAWFRLDGALARLQPFIRKHARSVARSENAGVFAAQPRPEDPVSGRLR